ncbi:MAG: adenylate cyclase, partial [Mycobacterium sp.]|nr:adenylate cyclase [Mycobacterium sp.]
MGCRVCGAEPRENARFCDACGSPMGDGQPAEYKQVTILFADVVHSMDIAAAVGAERLREIMAEVFNRSGAVVQRYGGTVDKFTGDGIMAVFGAPTALEDHAVRACLAASAVQTEIQQLATKVERRDGVALQLRVGLNSGEVIAGEIGSGPSGYTTVGEQVGMAQRMESVAPPGGVMLSESTARLAARAVELGEREMVHIKGAEHPVPAHRLLGIAHAQERTSRRDSTFVGRQWELSALNGILERSVSGTGSVVGIVGPPGIGKSRIVAEVVDIARGRAIEVFSTYCESHTKEVPFHAVARLLRSAFGVDELDDESVARTRVRAQIPGADSADLVLLDDVLGISDPAVDLPDIASDARRRRLTALVNSASLARPSPRVYVIEDAHWIDEVSESMLADFMSVVGHTRSMVVVTYRPEYRGALSRTAGAQTIALAPLDHSQTATLVAELVGSEQSVTGLTSQIAERADGNPFFVEEIVRDLADRGVLTGGRGNYSFSGEADEVTVPPTLQAAIAARIDRLDTVAKHTLNAAAVIGLRFGDDLLAELVDDPVLPTLIEAELIDQVMFTPWAEYAFRHPLIRFVAYQSQLKTDRADIHRRVAAAIERRSPGSVDENAALVAEHLETAGDLHDAFAWHMRAGTWLTNRDISAARMSWQRALQVADQLPADDPPRLAMRIAPRTLMCGSAWRTGGTVADTGFDELRDLTAAADDKVSLAIGMSGRTVALVVHAEFRAAAQLASEVVSLLESIDDPTLTLSLLYAALCSKFPIGELSEVTRQAQLCIDLADGDAEKGDLVIASPLAAALMFRGLARCCQGDPGWESDFDEAVSIGRRLADPTTYAVGLLYRYGIGLPNGCLAVDADDLAMTAEALLLAERSGDDFALNSARFARGLVLAHHRGPQCAEAVDLMEIAGDAARREIFTMWVLPIIGLETAKEKAHTGDLDDAIALARALVDAEFASGQLSGKGPAVTLLVELLLQRAAEADASEAQAAVDRLAALETEPGVVLIEVALLRVRALLAKAHGDADAFQRIVREYRERATAYGFEGHLA